MSDDLAKRTTELEIQLAHTQRMYEQLNEVVTEQASIIDRLQRTTRKLSDKLENVKNDSEDVRDPLDERPPHY